MCKVEMLRTLLNQRLSAAVDEILVVFQRTITQYEEELCRTKEENVRQRQLLDAVYKPQAVLNSHIAGNQEDLHPKQHDWSSRAKQEEPEPSSIKVEEEGHIITQETEQLQVLKFSVICVPVKSERYEEDSQSEENKRAEPTSSSSSQHMATEGDGGSEADRCLPPLSDHGDTTSDTSDEHAKETEITRKNLVNSGAAMHAEATTLLAPSSVRPCMSTTVLFRNFVGQKRRTRDNGNYWLLFSRSLKMNHTKQSSSDRG
ncbi:uncharacterized protein LOC144050803 isoform X5 [Vanacampus margaritifer]